MECFPACNVCTGICKERPSLPPVRIKNRIGKPYVASIPRAPNAIDEKRAGDILLVCDHFTSYEEAIIFEVFYTDRPEGKFWCEKCGRYEKPFITKKKVLPEQAEF